MQTFRIFLAQKISCVAHCTNILCVCVVVEYKQLQMYKSQLKAKKDDLKLIEDSERIK
jgi:hypothetical protein